MNCVGARRTELLLPLPDLESEVQALLEELPSDQVFWRERAGIRNAHGASFFTMMASDAELAINKLVCAQPCNAEQDLPTVNGMVTVCSALTGQPLLLLDGPVLTARRTAAVSMLAMDQLLCGIPRAVLMIGAGALARTHIEGLAQRRVAWLMLQSRTPAKAERTAQFARTLGMRCDVVTDTDTAVALAEVVFTLTSSSTPVLASVPPGVRLVVAAGSYHPGMAELTPEVVQSAREIFVDTVAGARSESGELVDADIDWSRVHELTDLMRLRPAHSDTGYRLFKSVGHSLWDLAAARLARRLYNIRTHPVKTHL